MRDLIVWLFLLCSVRWERKVFNWEPKNGESFEWFDWSFRSWVWLWKFLGDFRAGESFLVSFIEVLPDFTGFVKNTYLKRFFFNRFIEFSTGLSNFQPVYLNFCRKIQTLNRFHRFLKSNRFSRFKLINFP